MPFWKFIALLFFIPVISVQAQNIRRTYNQLYIGISGGPAFAINSKTQVTGRTFAASLTLAPKKQAFFYRAGFHNTVIEDNSQNYQLAHFGELPIHKNLSLSLSGGKTIAVIENIDLNLLAGLTATAYTAPQNITFRTKPYSYFDFETKTNFRPGLIVQAELIGMPFYRLGLGLGSFYHFVPGFSNAGVVLSLNIGKIRPKGFGIY